MAKSFDRPARRQLPGHLQSASLKGPGQISNPAPTPVVRAHSSDPGQAPAPTNIPIDRLRTDGGTRVRDIDPATVDEYREAVEGNATFPAVTAFDDGTDLWLADGFHRLEAHRQAGRLSILCRAHQGSQRDALLFAVGANAGHGLKRSPEDKRNAVRLLLSDPEWAGWSDRTIAERCRVGPHLVADVRHQVNRESRAEDRKSGARARTSETATRTGRDGKSYPSRKPKPAEPKPQPREPGSDDDKDESPNPTICPQCGQPLPTGSSLDPGPEARA